VLGASGCSNSSAHDNDSSRISEQNAQASISNHSNKSGSDILRSLAGNHPFGGFSCLLLNARKIRDAKRSLKASRPLCANESSGNGSLRAMARAAESSKAFSCSFCSNAPSHQRINMSGSVAIALYAADAGLSGYPTRAIASWHIQLWRPSNWCGVIYDAQLIMDAALCSLSCFSFLTIFQTFSFVHNGLTQVNPKISNLDTLH